MKVKVGVVQESPIFFDKEKTLQKLEFLVKMHSTQGCELLVFPESFIPGYPRGFDFGAKIGSRSNEGRQLFADYAANSIDLESDSSRLERISRENNCYLVIGVTERQNTNGSLHCSMLYISPNKGLLGVHRKIKPTGTERLVWAEAAGESLVSFQTKIGKLGGLICWENYMPMARLSMYQKGVEIYIAPTADSRETWTATMKHIAFEGRCFVLGCNQYYTKSMYPDQYTDQVKDEQENLCRGGSIIISPMGEIIAGPLFDKADVLVAELDLEDVQKSKLDFDVIGHYARNDIFNLNVIGQPEMKKE